MALLKSFSGGEGVTKALAAIAAKLNKAGTLRVGILEGATYPDGTNVATVAAIQEFGAPAAGIPPRPFFAPVVKAGEDTWGPMLGKVAQAADYDTELTLNRMGAVIASQLQTAIREIDSPALSPITVMLRGMRSHDQTLVVTGATVGEAAARVAAGETNYGASDKPLVDSGHLLNSISWEVTP